MKSYYHAHESVYQQIKSNGFVGWGNAKSLEELGDVKTNEYLKQKIEKYFSEVTGKSALDLGCGTGTTAFTLAKHGLATTGIDISETALEMGKDLARQQNLEIQFVAGDVLDLKSLGRKFDFIYDSHFLHCIVLEEDRKKVFDEIKSILKAGGIFILDTMVMPNSEIDPATMFHPLRFDQNFILWHKTKPSSDRGIVEVEGQHWCAQRRIYPAEIVINEIRLAGFEILEQQIDEQDNQPSMLRMVLR
jgi:2-polyprenyl-3-methyl-5-hydroxy-6-metoxy-1,4-benzoquinol methylase